jgi:hypothetical protein
MQVRFVLASEDVSRYQRFAVRHLPWGQRLQLSFYQALGVALLIWILAGAFVLFRWPPHAPIQSMLAVLGVVTVFACAALLLGTAAGVLAPNIGLSSKMRGEHVLTISPGGLTYHNQCGEQALTWGEVLCIQQDQQSLYFLLRRQGLLALALPGEANAFTRPILDHLGLQRVYIVPKRAFAQPLEAASFLDAAIAFWGNARQTGVGPG